MEWGRRSCGERKKARGVGEELWWGRSGEGFHVSQRNERCIIIHGAHTLC